MKSALLPMERRWVRSTDGYIAGVCEGLGRRFGVDPTLIRVAWVVSILAFGSGLLLYVIMAICLPREDDLQQADRKRLLGVCVRLSRSLGMDVGLVRVLAVLLALASFGATAVGYIILHFVLTEEPDGHSV